MAVRVGFVGCGGINKAHMANLAGIKDAKMVAFCDVQKDRAQEVAEQYGGEMFTDYKAMYDEVELDAVYIALPPFAHTDQELLAVQKKLAIFVEKPMALDMKLARKVAREVETAGVISTVGFQDRYLDIIKRLQGELDKNPPGLMMGYWMGGMPQVAWWRRKEQSGGQIVEQTIHIFDMARYLFGEVKSVQTVSSKGLMKDVPKYNIEDASAVNLQFKSGLCGTIFSACFLEVGNRGGMDIWSKKAMYRYDERVALTVNKPGKDAQRFEPKKNCLEDIDKTFIKAVKTNDQSLLKSSYADAAKSLAIVLAANEAIATGEVVKVR